jgi:hypothetical protein
MKIEIDDRPAKDNRPCSYAIRIYPETNKEMAQLERPLAIKFNVSNYHRIGYDGNSVCYSIDFQKVEEK